MSVGGRGSIAGTCLSHHKKTSDWLLQPSLPLYDLDNSYGGSMGKQKDHLSRLERRLSITQYWVLIRPSHNGLQWDSKEIHLWTRIFYVRLHSINETRSFLEKILFWKKSESPLSLFYFKRANKTRKKTLKRWLHSFWKSMSLKNPSSSLGIKLPIGKVHLKGRTSLSPTKVSTD